MACRCPLPRLRMSLSRTTRWQVAVLFCLASPSDPNIDSAQVQAQDLDSESNWSNYNFNELRCGAIISALFCSPELKYLLHSLTCLITLPPHLCFNISQLSSPNRQLAGTRSSITDIRITDLDLFDLIGSISKT